jgi:hypothetical protein
MEDNLFNYLESKLKSVKRFNENITFLGMNISRDLINNKITLSQVKYANEIVNSHLSPDIQPSKYPITNIDLSKCTPGNYPKAQVIIGKIRYLADRTRPDLLYPLSYLSKFTSKPSRELMIEITRLLRYIKGTVNKTITLGSEQPISMFAMSDASFIQSNDCKSQLGYAIFLSDDSGCVSSKSSSNHCVNISSTHAEVDALVEAIKEVLWYRGLLNSLNVNVNKASIIYVDNKPAVTLSAEGNNLKRSKHFIVKSAYIKELVKNGILNITHIPGKYNHADLLTKALFGESLSYHTDGILGSK